MNHIINQKNAQESATAKRYKIYCTRILESEAGFSLVEVIVSIIVFSIMALMLAQLYASGTLFVVNQGDRRKATLLAQERLETVSATLFSDVETDLALSPVVENNPNGYTNLTRTTSYDYVDDDDFTSVVAGPTRAIRVSVVVSSTQGIDGFENVSIQNVVTSWKNW